MPTIRRGERGRGTGSSRRPTVKSRTVAQKAKRPSRSVGLTRGGAVRGARQATRSSRRSDRQATRSARRTARQKSRK